MNVIDQLLQTERCERALHLNIDENERLLGSLQSELLGVRRKLDEEYSKRRNWETEFHRVNRVVRGSQGLGAGSQTEFQISTEMGRDERQRSRSRGSTTRNVDSGDSRRSDGQFTDQRNDSSRPARNMNQQGLHRVQYRQESQGRDGGEGHPDTYTRGVPLKRGMQSFFSGRSGGSQE